MVWLVRILFVVPLFIAPTVRSADDRMNLPFDLIANAPGFKLLAGVDPDGLTSTQGFVGVAFADTYVAGVPAAVARHRGGFDFEEIATLKELTEKSAFAVQASYKGFSYSVAAKINRERETSLNDRSIRTYAYSKYETSVLEAPYDATLASDSFKPDVIAMRAELDTALAAGKLNEAADVRQRFKRTYGTGFIRSITSGGMFYLQRTQTFSSREERDKRHVAVSGGGGGARVSAQSTKETEQKIEETFQNIKGKFVGGKYTVANATWDEFKPTAKEWAQSILDGATEPLSAEFVPYYSIDYLRPLTERPRGSISQMTTIMGYYGTPDRPQAAMFVSYADGERIEVGSLPGLLPISGYVNDNEVRLLVSVDPDTIRTPQIDRANAWKTVKETAVGSFGAATKNVEDPKYLETAYVWPALVIDTGGESTKWAEFLPNEKTMELPVKLLVDDQVAANNGFRTEGSMSGRYVFNVAGRSAKDIKKLVDDGKMRLATYWTVDFMDIRRSDSRPLQVLSTDTDGRIAYRFPGVPLRSETVKFNSDVATAIQSRIFAAMNGPAKKVVPIPPGPLMTHAWWANGKVFRKCTDKTKVGYEWDIKDAPEGMVLVGTLVKQEKSGFLQGGCRTDDECNGLNEGCWTMHNHAAGCYVSKEWWDWYSPIASNYKLSMDPAFICDAKVHGQTFAGAPPIQPSLGNPPPDPPQANPPAQ